MGDLQPLSRIIHVISRRKFPNSIRQARGLSRGGESKKDGGRERGRSGARRDRSHEAISEAGDSYRYLLNVHSSPSHSRPFFPCPAGLVTRFLLTGLHVVGRLPPSPAQRGARRRSDLPDRAQTSDFLLTGLRQDFPTRLEECLSSQILYCWKVSKGVPRLRRESAASETSCVDLCEWKEYENSFHEEVLIDFCLYSLNLSARDSFQDHCRVCKFYRHSSGRFQKEGKRNTKRNKFEQKINY